MDFVHFAARNQKWQPMLSLYDKVCSEYGDELYGSAIMGGGLVLSNRPEVEHDEGVVLIYFNPSKPSFELSYRNRDVEPAQSEQCSPDDIWERLRLFIAYKFGIHRKPAATPVNRRQ
jgi:hypothetical protein